MYVCIHLYVSMVHTYVCILFMNICVLCECVSTCLHVHICMFVHVCIYVCVCAHTHTHACFLGKCSHLRPYPELYTSLSVLVVLISNINCNFRKWLCESSFHHLDKEPDID